MHDAGQEKGAPLRQGQDAVLVMVAAPPKELLEISPCLVRTVPHVDADVRTTREAEEEDARRGALDEMAHSREAAFFNAASLSFCMRARACFT